MTTLSFVQDHILAHVRLHQFAPLAQHSCLREFIAHEIPFSRSSGVKQPLFDIHTIRLERQVEKILHIYKHYETRIQTTKPLYTAMRDARVEGICGYLDHERHESNTCRVFECVDDIL
jgi:hypothetical protein